MKFIIFFSLILAASQVFGQGEIDERNATEIERHVADYVEEQLAKWSIKGEFESNQEWENRIETQQNEKKQQYVHEILDEYYGRPENLELGEYDAEREYFIVETDSFGNFILPVKREDGPAWRKKCYVKEYIYGLVQGKVSIVRLLLRNEKNDTEEALPFDKETEMIGRFYWKNDTWEYDPTGEKETNETLVEEMPIFPKGNLAKWLVKNIKYPQDALKKGIRGKVYVQFVIEKDGSITDVTVIKGVDPIVDKEAIRVVEAMPKWIPARSKGKPVRCAYTIVVPFNP